MSASERQMLTIALAKGRMLDSTLNLLAAAGYAAAGLRERGRRLVFEDRNRCLRFILAKPIDVPTYVEHGAADLGVVGKDILLEQPRDIYELLDLKIGCCRMVVACQKGKQPALPGFVATSYPAITESHFTRKGQQVEIIKLHGSVELAPLLGLAGTIVDLVSTGATLRENDLEEVEEIAAISSRLVANQGSYQVKGERIAGVLRRLQAVIE